MLVDKVLVLRAINELPEQVQRIIMSIVFPPRQITESNIKQYLFQSAPKHRKRPSNTIKGFQSSIFIPFLLNQEREMILHPADISLYPVERRWIHDWCDALKLEHISHDVPDRPHIQFNRMLVIKKAPGWSIKSIVNI